MKDLPLYQIIYNHYLREIEHGILKEGDQLPTEREITDEFSVSRITAKKAINMLSDQNYVTRIPGKGTFVTKRFDAKELFSNKNKFIGVLLCDIDYSFGLDLLKSLEFEINKMGYKMIFKRTYESRDKEVESIREFIDVGVEGIIIQTVHGHLYNDEILRIYLSGFPMVFVDRYMDKMNIPFVSSDNLKASFDLTNRLIAGGYKNILFTSANLEGTTTLQQRYDGFIKAGTSDVKLSLLTLETPLTSVKSEDSIEKDLSRIVNKLKEDPNIDCVFASEIYVAKLATQAFKELGLRVPEDIGLVTFDNDTESSKYAYYTHVKQDEKLIGKTAVSIIYDIINNKIGKYSRRIFIDPVIYLGKTTKKI